MLGKGHEKNDCALNDFKWSGINDTFIPDHKWKMSSHSWEGSQLT